MFFCAAERMQMPKAGASDRLTPKSWRRCRKVSRFAQAGLSGHVSPLCRLIGDMLGKGNRSTLQWLNFLRTKRIYHRFRPQCSRDCLRELFADRIGSGSWGEQSKPMEVSKPGRPDSASVGRLGRLRPLAMLLSTLSVGHEPTDIAGRSRKCATCLAAPAHCYPELDQ